MRHALACGFSCLLTSTALAADCSAPPYPPTVADFAAQSGFEAAEGKEPIEVQAQATLSPEGLAGLVGVLCAADQIENMRYRNRFIQGVLASVQSPDPEDLEQTIERFSSRLDINVPASDLTLLRADIAAISGEIAVERARLLEDLAEQDESIQRQRDEIARLEAQITKARAQSAEARAQSAEARAQSAEARAQSAEAQARIAEINARIARLDELLSVAKENLRMLEAIAGQ